MNITHILPVLHLGRVAKKVVFGVARRQSNLKPAENQGAGLA